MLSPFTANADPVTFACEIVTLELPELVRVPDKFVLLPTWTVPKLRPAGFAATVPAETPVAEREMLTVGFDPLSLIVIPPFTKPLDWGANVTLKLVLCPGESVNGGVNPLKLKPLPVAVAWEILRLEPPEFVRVTEVVRLLIEIGPAPRLDDAADARNFGLRIRNFLLERNALFAAATHRLLAGIVAALALRLRLAVG